MYCMRHFSEYHLQYVEDFSKTFFHVNRGEEWFRERYNPLKMYEQEQENAIWAAKESEAFQMGLSEDPVGVIAAMNLDSMVAKHDNR